MSTVRQPYVAIFKNWFSDVILILFARTESHNSIPGEGNRRLLKRWKSVNLDNCFKTKTFIQSSFCLFCGMLQNQDNGTHLTNVKLMNQRLFRGGSEIVALHNSIYIRPSILGHYTELICIMLLTVLYNYVLCCIRFCTIVSLFIPCVAYRLTESQIAESAI